MEKKRVSGCYIVVSSILRICLSRGKMGLRRLGKLTKILNVIKSDNTLNKIIKTITVVG